MDKEDTIDKICLVTGSTQGIGLSIAEKIGEQGSIVVISSRKEENSIRAEETLKMKNIDYDYFTCNFDIKENRKELKENIKKKYGKLDTLVCTVSTNPFIGKSFTISEKEFDKIINTNIKNTFFTIIDFLDLLKKGKNSSVLLVSSHAGYVPLPKLGIFSMSKLAIISMTKMFAQELAKFNIRVNCVASGLVQTRQTSSNNLSLFTGRIFLKRSCLPHEISGIAAFLCSDEASFITGETVCVNGGMVGRL